MRDKNESLSNTYRLVIEEIKNKDKFHPVELFCNEVAANALMPKEIVLNFNG